MDTIRALVAVHDAVTRKQLLRMLERASGVTVVDVCETAAQAVSAADRTELDLLLLEVALAGTSGFEVLQVVSSERQPEVIFVGGSDSDAVRAYEVGAVDYVVKPVEWSRLSLALERARGRLRTRDGTAAANGAPEPSIDYESVALRGSLSNNGRYFRRIMVKSADRIVFVDTQQIDWIEARGDLLVLHAGETEHLVRSTMKEMEGKLDPEDFFRIHRSAIINLARLVELQPYFHGEYVVVLSDGTRLRLARGRRESLERFLGQSI